MFRSPRQRSSSFLVVVVVVVVADFFIRHHSAAASEAEVANGLTNLGSEHLDNNENELIAAAKGIIVTWPVPLNSASASTDTKILLIQRTYCC